MDERLGAERAAYRRADDAHLLLVKPEHSGDVRAHVERRVRPRPELQPLSLPAGKTGVRLHRRVLGGRRSERLLDDLVGLLEAALDVAVADAEEVAHVRALLGSQPEVGGVVVRDPVPIVDEHGALERLLEVEHGRQLLVLDVDESERGLGLLRSLGRHGGHRVTGKAGPIDREHRLVADLAAEPGEIADVRRRHRDGSAGHGRGVHAKNARMRIGRAEDAAVQHPRQLLVLGVAQRAVEHRPQAVGDPGHSAASSCSRARRTSTAMTRLR